MGVSCCSAVWLAASSSSFEGVAGVGNCMTAGHALLLGEPVNNDEGDEGSVTMSVVVPVFTAVMKSWSVSGDGKSWAGINGEKGACITNNRSVRARVCALCVPRQ